MNPNSAHQQWSEWVFTVEAAGPQPAFDAVTLPLGRFFTSVFGCTGRMKVEQALNPVRRRTIWTITVQTEGESCYEPGWRARVLQGFTLAAQRRFGGGVRVQMDVALLAGQTLDARPNAQWLILPTLSLEPELPAAAMRPAQSMGLATVAPTTRMW